VKGALDTFIQQGSITMVRTRTILRRACLAASVAVAALGMTATTARADMPAAAKKLIDELKLAPEVVAGWEEEQAVPAAWLEGAKKEARLRINGSWESAEFREMTKAFAERYPFIRFNYSRGSNDTRVRTPLIAFREGRYTTDVVTGIDSALNDFREINALADLRDLPNIKNIPDEMQTTSGDWASVRLRYWCMSYNPKLISKEQMPKTWEDLLTTKQLYDGRLALWRGVSSWLLPLWNAKGEAWTTQYIQKLFMVVQPQKRKEGAVALVNLVIAGEFNASLASAEYQVKKRLDKGAPVAFHCPDVVPVTASTVGILKGNPSINASKIFINWLISKEGQLAQYAAGGAPPLHRDLIQRGFMPFPEEIAGKKVAFRSPDLLDDDITAMFKVLKPYWEGSVDSDE
jgi:iron(III) transport system substrate-binding protein